MAIYLQVHLWKLVFTTSLPLKSLVQGRLDRRFHCICLCEDANNWQAYKQHEEPRLFVHFPTVECVGEQIGEVRLRRLGGDASGGFQTWESGVASSCTVSGRELPGWLDNQIHIHKNSVRERRRVRSTFLLQHSSKAPVLIIRQPYKSGEVDWLLRPSPVYTWLMAEN